MPLMRRSPNICRGKNRIGAAAVEFAMTAPVLITLLFGALELGRMNMVRQTANDAAYAAVRKCTVPGATAADGEAAGLAILQSIGVKGATVELQPDPILNTTPEMTATVTVPFNNNMWSAPLYSKNGSVTVTCKMTRDWVVSTKQSQ